MTGELLFCTSAASALALGLGAALLLLGCVVWWAIAEGRRDKGSRVE